MMFGKKKSKDEAYYEKLGNCLDSMCTRKPEGIEAHQKKGAHYKPPKKGW